MEVKTNRKTSRIDRVDFKVWENIASSFFKYEYTYLKKGDTFAALKKI